MGIRTILNYVIVTKLVVITCVLGFSQRVHSSQPEDVATQISSPTAESGEKSFGSVMQKQLEAYRKKLADSEFRLQEYQQKHGLISLSEQQRLLLEQRKDLDTSFKSAQNKAQGFKEKLSWLKTQIQGIPPEIPLTSVSERQKVIDEAKNNMLNLQLKEEQLLASYRESSRLVLGIRNKIKIVEVFIKNQETLLADTVTTGKNPVYQEMQMEIVRTEGDLISAQGQLIVIKSQISDVDQELSRMSHLGTELDQLKREVTADERNYEEYLKRVGAIPQEDYRIQVGDQIDIKFFFNPELNEQVKVRPDGRIALQLVGEIMTAGLTAEELKAVLIKEYERELKNPEVAVLVRSFSAPVTEDRAQNSISPIR